MRLTTLTPNDVAEIAPAVLGTRNPRVWVYRCDDEATGWTLSAATHAEPGSGMLSLGGFRIAPASRMEAPGFSTEREAALLALGMEEKVHWSRVMGIGGPLARHRLRRMVGGKCVVAPTPDARVGAPRDRELLDFAIHCFRAIETAGGFRLTTGQDLGHGLMSDGTTQSLHYLNARFAGSAIADTSVPTGEGNYRLLVGMLRAFGIDVADATVGLLGCGHVGMHVLHRLRERGTRLLACEPWNERRAEVHAMGIPTWDAAGKSAFLAQPMDALVVNAAGGSLDRAAVDVLRANPRVKVVCGSENLVMPDPSAAALLQQAGKVYAPTELGGMMGYLTAAEEYLAREAGMPFEVATLLEAAGDLEQGGHDATARVIASGGRERFEDAVAALALAG